MKSNAIALNISPLVLRKDNDDKIIKKNVYNLISYILKNTSYNIFLVPHVVIHVDNDFEALSEIADEFNSSRIWNVSSDLSASEYKYIISKCDLGVYARTHATIASYSSLVPTIAIGYSIKAQGIAKDLGMSKFVLPISEIIDETKLTTMFKLLVNEKDEVKEILSKIIPTYSLKANVKI
jgi:polysaccharide pyruvyl transferase WcaK-like protein